MNRHIFSGSKINREARQASFDKAAADAQQSIERPDLRCEKGHRLHEYHQLEDGVGHRLLCPICDSDYIKELADKKAGRK